MFSLSLSLSKQQLTPSQNQIRDDSVKSPDKFDSQQTQNSQTRWRIPPPSRTILPPAFEPQIELTSSTPQPRPRVSSSTTTTTSTRRPTTTPPPVSHKRTEALYQRTADMEADDLGTSHSTRYNTSADFNSAEQPTTKNSTKLVKFIKPPSKIYEPPFVYPIYNQDVQEVQPVTETLRTSSAMPFSTAATQTRFSAAAARPSTTTRPPSRPTTYAGQPFSQSTAATTASTTTNYRPAVAQTEHRTPTPAQAFRQTTPTSTVAPRAGGKGELPFNDLLPPFVDFVPHDIATTQGPPIYYEWKVPANGLVPPKLDPPIGVDGREYPETKADYNVKVKLESFNSKFNDIANTNAVAAASGAVPKRLPSSRSIKPNELPLGSTEKAQRRADVVSTGSGSSSPLTSDITQLRKQLLIPEYAFPLETIGRTGYAPGSSVAGDLYNSFQLKIPERRAGSGSSFSSSSTQGRWFGENPKCPECHPSFVVPGTCEPCLRR